MKNIKYLSLFLLVFLFSTQAFSQENKSNEEVKLTIVVKDANNKPVPGAVILIDGVKQNRVSNTKGVFKAKLDKTPKKITAYSSLIGVKKIDYTGKNDITINIVGGSDHYAINTSKNKVDNAIQFKTIYDYMRGKVVGVNIASDNTITIRGFNTVNGSTQPLFMLNDAFVDQSIFSDIVPTTIKSISVIKGPETAIYGIRGANGVIKVITF